jgi:hypothetical protein
MVRSITGEKCYVRETGKSMKAAELAVLGGLFHSRIAAALPVKQMPV